jgi:hypothetical protein
VLDIEDCYKSFGADHSHMSGFIRGVQDVHEPGVLLLLGTGLIAFVLCVVASPEQGHCWRWHCLRVTSAAASPSRRAESEAPRSVVKLAAAQAGT